MTPPPVLAVSAVVIDHDELLLVERRTGPAAGDWAVPGGHVEPGESLADAVAREVHEETALVVAAGQLIGLNEVIGDSSHFVVACYEARLCGPRAATAGSDAAAVAWVPLNALDGVRMVPGLQAFLRERGAIPG